MSFASETRGRSQPVLPLSAMVDMLFLLLVFFMTVSVFREQEKQIDISLPDTQTATAPQSKTPIIVTITETGEIYIGDRPYKLDQLQATMAKLAEQFPNEMVVVRGDKGSAFGLAVQVMDVARASGLRNISIATSKLQSEL
ncbi:MAG: ExbD/TolR family protein [Phycisphaeraceae bacterium JB051]